jgi:hypothetical protein
MPKLWSAKPSAEPQNIPLFFMPRIRMVKGRETET